MNNKLDLYKRLITQDIALTWIDIMLYKLELEILDDIKKDKNARPIKRRKH